MLSSSFGKQGSPRPPAVNTDLEALDASQDFYAADDTPEIDFPLITHDHHELALSPGQG